MTLGRIDAAGGYNLFGIRLRFLISERDFVIVVTTFPKTGHIRPQRACFGLSGSFSDVCQPLLPASVHGRNMALPLSLYALAGMDNNERIQRHAARFVAGIRGTYYKFRLRVSYMSPMLCW